MTRRTKIVSIVISVLVLALIALLIWTGLGRPRLTSTPPTNTEPRVPPVTSPSLPPMTPPQTIEPPPTEPVPENADVVAANFTERYGSYSNQGNYQNLRDLYPVMTTALRARTEAFIAANPLPAGDYFGVTTKVVRATVTSETTGSATVSVATQRIEMSAANPDRVFYQNAELTLVKDGLHWYVDTFAWQQ